MLIMHRIPRYSTLSCLHHVKLAKSNTPLLGSVISLAAISKTEQSNISHTRLYSSEPSNTSTEITNRNGSSGNSRQGEPRRISHEPPRLPPLDAKGRSKQGRWSFGRPAKAGGIFLAFLWTAYFVKAHFFEDETAKIPPADLPTAPALDPNAFSTFILTHREQIADDLYVIELSPPYEKVKHLQKTRNKRTPAYDPRDPPLANDPGLIGVWDGSRTWSVEVVQPQLQVVRRYTPLPLLYVLGLRPSEAGTERTALLRILGPQLDKDEGKIVLLVRRYADGELSRYLCSIPINSRVALRGPFTELTLPATVNPRSITDPKRVYLSAKNTDLNPLLCPMIDNPSQLPPPFPRSQVPSNIVFFAAGTGIAPALQLLLSKNPPPGRVILHYSVRRREDIAFPRFLLFLEKTGRAEIHYHVDEEKTALRAKDIPKPISPSDSVSSSIENFYFSSTHDFSNAIEWNAALLKQCRGKLPARPAYAIVSGPEGFIEYVAGKRADVTTLNSPVGEGVNRDADEQGKIGGLLKSKGWNESNVYKL
ncbi:uncharacterized protein V2V93DRAFT_368968 [Kockiozyma suomiensis]|uniref:uncharacterized protein n=1 Tax=Kockiozyma suomiensis TaxID=1337062 RepID=UPI0033440BEE